MVRTLTLASIVLLATVAGAAPVEPTPKEQAVRTVVRAVAEKAAAIQKLPPKERPTGDALTDTYIRSAAAAALPLDKSVRAPGFLIGLGIALDDSTILSGNPLTKKLCAAAETADERKDRIKNLGSPTIHKRRDLCQHFAVSVALTEIFGPALAELAGVAKERADMKGTSGFSFVDLALDLAGIEFAVRIQKTPGKLDGIAKEFAIADYAPAIDGLSEGLNEAAFQKEFGGPTDPRYTGQVEAIRKRVQAVKAYKE